AVDAVWREPVSSSKSLFGRENTGNFVNPRGFRTVMPLKSTNFEALTGDFPKLRNSELPRW
ncbi:MAG TPA: hypothetical protein VLX09_19805, partial [Stellaceae bacterium]|nr:hypothetical protein [Stellaceae bacterium]